MDLNVFTASNKQSFQIWQHSKLLTKLEKGKKSTKSVLKVCRNDEITWKEYFPKFFAFSEETLEISIKHQLDSKLCSFTLNELTNVLEIINKMINKISS